MESNKIESPLMTIPETAEHLKMSIDTLYLLVKDKDFPAIKVDRRWRVITKELDLWIMRQYEEKPDSRLIL